VTANSETEVRIGIFGGTFNPIHRAHLSIAEEVRRALRLGKVLFIPAGDPPHKKDMWMIPARHRLSMVQLAVKGHPHFEVSDLEVKRPGKSYTIETVRALKRAYPPGTEWYLILGLDAFLEFPSWRLARRLLTQCHFVVVSRPGFRFRDVKRLLYFKDADPLELNRLDRGLKKRCEFPTGPSTRLILLRIRPREVSATAIRNHFGGGKRKRNLLPRMVESYIMTHHLLGIEDRNRPSIPSRVIYPF
jgi:nicotinate-nucleotide adenylyltransferase